MTSKSARGIYDLLALLVPMALVTAISYAAGFSTTDYLRFAPVFCLFLLPGWCLSPAVLWHRPSSPLLARFVVSAFLSYVLYGLLALGCRLLGLGYIEFFVLFSISTLGALAAWWRRLDGTTFVGSNRHFDNWLLVALIVVVASVFYCIPYSADQGIFDLNILESLERQNFDASALDVLPFGIEDAQPRMKANLFHAIFGVLASASNVSPLALTYYVAAPFFGMLLLLALTLFVREISGPDVNVAFVFLSILAPWTLLYSSFSPYWYEFRVLNSPTLDKDFANFFLVPAMLTMAYRYLVHREVRWLWLILVSLPVVVFTHPVAPIYFLTGSAALVVSLTTRARIHRSGAIILVGLVGLGISLVAIDPSETHPFIDRIIELDLQGDRKHFWPAHYSSPGQNYYSSVIYLEDGLAVFKPSQFFGSSLIRHSVQLTFFWILLLLASRVLTLWRHFKEPRRPTREAVLLVVRSADLRQHLLLGVGSCLAAESARRIGAATVVDYSLLIVAAIGALLGLLLLLGSAWSSVQEAGDVDGSRQSAGVLAVSDADLQEARALRLQAVFIGLLVLMYVGSVLVLYIDRSLYRGLERLHWGYFGFFSLVFVASRVWSVVCQLVRRWLPHAPRLALAVALVPQVALVGHVADQSLALANRRPTIMAGLGLGFGVADAETTKGTRLGRHYSSAVAFSLNAERGAEGPLVMPSWLHDDDRVLHLPGFGLGMSALAEGRYQMMKRSVYHRELYSEAFALQHFGAEFIPSFLAYNDAADGQVTPRLLAWLKQREVTIISTINARFVERLGERMHRQIVKLAPHTYRITQPAQSR